MLQLRNQLYTGSNERQSVFDLEIPDGFNGKTIVFVHGFMGFKDWGAWNLMQDFFIKKGFGFAKFNLTHNGGTIENPIDFPDEIAFGNNTYTKELNDIGFALQAIESILSEQQHPVDFLLMGHSRGGGMILLAGAKYPSVSKLISLAPICSIATRFPQGETLEEWKKTGVRTVENGRTKQQLPMYYSLYEDFVQNAEELDIEACCKSLKKPLLVVHGTADSSVNIEEGKNVVNWSKSTFISIENADHVFGASQPWTKEMLPKQLAEVCQHVLEFIQ